MHIPVLLAETVESLAVKSGGVYVDGTLGRAGHSSAILARAGAGATLVGIDCDTQALTESAERLKEFSGSARIEMVHGCHGDLARLAREKELEKSMGFCLIWAFRALSWISPSGDSASEAMDPLTCGWIGRAG